MRLVMDIADRILVLDFGQPIALGAPDVIQSDPRVLEAYLGTDRARRAGRGAIERRDSRRSDDHGSGSVTAMVAFSEFLQLSASGLALGCLYGLVALGFVIVLASSGVLNLMHGGFVLARRLPGLQRSRQLGTALLVAVALAAAICAVLGVVLEALVVRRFETHEHLAALLVTLGLLYITEPVVTAIWGYDLLNLEDPWALKTVAIGDVRLTERDIAVFVITLIVFSAFFALLRFSSLGVACGPPPPTGRRRSPRASARAW